MHRYSTQGHQLLSNNPLTWGREHHSTGVGIWPAKAHSRLVPRGSKDGEWPLHRSGRQWHPHLFVCWAKVCRCLQLHCQQLCREREGRDEVGRAHRGWRGRLSHVGEQSSPNREIWGVCCKSSRAWKWWICYPIWGEPHDAGIGHAWQLVQSNCLLYMCTVHGVCMTSPLNMIQMLPSGEGDQIVTVGMKQENRSRNRFRNVIACKMEVTSLRHYLT